MANEFKVRKGLIVQGSGSNILDVQGSQGQLFSVTDSLSGSLFSVNDISGIPIMEVFSDNTIKMGTFNQEAIIISGSRTGMGTALPQAELHISGANNQSLLQVSSPSATSSLFVSGSGNVGIGTATPTNTLNVNGTTFLQGGQTTVRGSGATSATTALRVENSNQSASLTILDNGTSAFNTSHLYISSSGNVGIGTTTPLSLVHISASSGNEFLRITSGSQNILNIRSGSVVFFAGTGTAPSSGYDLDIQGTGTAYGGTVRIAGNGTVYAFSSAGSITRGGTSNSEMFGMTMGGVSSTAIQNPLRVEFNAGQNATSGSGYIVLRLNATHASTAGTGSKLLQTWEFGGVRQSVMDISGSLGIGTGSAPPARLFISGANNANLLRVSSPSASSALFVSGSGNVGIGTSTPAGLIDIFQGGNSRILVTTDTGRVGIQQSSPAEQIHITSDPASSKYLRIDAVQISNSPREVVDSPATAILGYDAADSTKYLSEPRWWMEIKLDGNTVLIPCYQPDV